MNPMRRPEPPDLGHHRLALARLDVRDVHVDAALEMRQFVPESGRAQVPADSRQLALLVAERGLDHQVRDLDAAQPLPQQRVRAGVAGVDPPAAWLAGGLVLAAAKVLAAHQGKSVGAVLSALARQALRAAPTDLQVRNGVPLLLLRSGVLAVTPALIQQLHDGWS